MRRLGLRGEFARNVGVLAGGTALGQAIVVLASPLITRLYDPADFGGYAAVASLVSILSILAPLGYHRAIPLPASDDSAAALVLLSVLASAVMSVVAGVVLWVGGSQILDLLNSPQVGSLLWIVIPGQLAAALYGIVSTWALRERAFPAIAATRFAQGASTVALQFVLSGLGGAGLVVGDVVGRAAGTARLGLWMLRSQLPHMRRVTTASLRAVAGRYRRFPIYTNASALLDALGLELPILIMLGLYGPGTGGLYLLVARVAGIPAGLVGVAASQVTFADAARMGDDPVRLRGLMRMTTRRLLMLAVVPALLAAMIAPAAFPVVFGAEWVDAGWYLTMLVPMYVLQFVAAPTGAILAVLERQDLGLLRDALRVVLFGSAALIAVAYSLPPVATVAAISVSGAVGYVIYQLIPLFALRAHERNS